MSVLNNATNLFLAADAATPTGYQVSRSLRFNAGDSAHLTRTPSVAGNQQTFTFSAWVKRCVIDTDQVIFARGNTFVNFDGASKIYANHRNGGTNYFRISEAVFRDPSAWLHLLWVVDTTNASAQNRARIWVNGVELTAWTQNGTIPQNFSTEINTTSTHVIGRELTYGQYGNFYLADVHFIDGQALDPSSFTTTDLTTGQLIPKAYTGSYGTNGFKLNFSDNSTAAALGTDTSGNGNTWTVNNLTVDSAGFSNTIASSQVWSSYLTPSSTGWDGLSRNATKAFDNDITTFAYVSSGSSSEYINFSFPSGISNHGGFVWLYGGNGNGQGLDNMTVTVNGSTVSSISRTGTTWNNWFKFPVSGTLTSFRITGVYPVLNAVSFWSDYSSNVLDSQSITYGAQAFRGGDSLVDTPTSYGTDTGVGGEVRGNYATLNPLGTAGATPTNGNLSVSSSSTVGNRISTFFLTNGKWYWEGSGNGYVATVVGRGGEGFTGSVSVSGSKAIGWYPVGGLAHWDGGNSGSGTTYSNTDVIGVALDMDAGTVKFYKNNTLIHNLTFGSGTVPNLSTGVFPGYNVGADTASVDLNFGQRAFAYTAPSGFKALVDTNLPTPVIAKPNTVMDVALWTGNGSTQTISGLGFSPDLVWIKQRSAVRSHWWTDTVRGNTKLLSSDQAYAEITETDCITAFNSDGFSLDADAGFNANAGTYVAWAWDAGTSTVTNTAGSISSQVRANASAGFSVVTYTGTGTVGATVGHGLGVAPTFMIFKRRNDGTLNWRVYHKDIGNTKILFLSLTNAATTDPAWNNTTPSSTVFTLGNDGAINVSGGTTVAYCFAPVSGYSSFGSYTGNGSADGPFVYTGFRPRWVMIKNSSANSDSTYGSWKIIDTSRDSFNGGNPAALYANAAYAEGKRGNGGNDTYAERLDLLSNGFKLGASASYDIETNENGVTYIYAAFAENPFQYARAR